MKGNCDRCGKAFEAHAQTYKVNGQRICRWCFTDIKTEKEREKNVRPERS